MANEVLDLTADLTRLVDLATSEGAVEDLLRRGLEWVSRLAPYDLATIFELEGDALRIRAAKGPLASGDVRDHAIELARYPSIREAIETRRARAFTDDDHAHGDGDPFGGTLAVACAGFADVGTDGPAQRRSGRIRGGPAGPDTAGEDWPSQGLFGAHIG